MTLVLLTALAAGAGSCLRHVVDVLVQRRHGTGLPWGTFVVNLSGSLLVGVLLGLAGRDALAPEVAKVLSVGLLGGYTTLSTWAWDTVVLAQAGARRTAVLNAVGTHAACTGAAAVGLALARL